MRGTGTKLLCDGVNASEIKPCCHIARWVCIGTVSFSCCGCSACCDVDGMCSCAHHACGRRTPISQNNDPILPIGIYIVNIGRCKLKFIDRPTET